MFTSASACHTDEEIEALNKMPWLANPLLKFDLPHELEDLRRKESSDRKPEGIPNTPAKNQISQIFRPPKRPNTYRNKNRPREGISFPKPPPKSLRFPETKGPPFGRENPGPGTGVLSTPGARGKTASLSPYPWRRHTQKPRAEVAADQSSMRTLYR